jgi:hypothetical protein
VGPALIDDDLVKPASKVIRVIAPAKSAERPHESGLKRIVRIHVRAEHSHSETGTRVLITPNQAGKRVDIAGEDGRNQLSVRQACHK